MSAPRENSKENKVTSVRSVGALRGRNPKNPEEWIEANPGDMLFSTICFFASQFWNGKKWVDVSGLDE